MTAAAAAGRRCPSPRRSVGVGGRPSRRIRGHAAADGALRAAASKAAAIARGLDQPVRETYCLQAAVQFDDVTVAHRLTELAARIGTPRAVTAAARARRLAVACGAISPALSAVAAAVPAPFTYTEREIAVLVAQDMSNREIAQMMSLSVRAVESHIYRAARKAGVTGRAGLRNLVESG